MEVLRYNPELKADIERPKKLKPKPHLTTTLLQPNLKRKSSGKQARFTEAKRLARATGSNTKNDVDWRKCDQWVSKNNKDKGIFKKNRRDFGNRNWLKTIKHRASGSEKTKICQRTRTLSPLQE